MGILDYVTRPRPTDLLGHQLQNQPQNVLLGINPNACGKTGVEIGVEYANQFGRENWRVQELDGDEPRYLAGGKRGERVLLETYLKRYPAFNLFVLKTNQDPSKRASLLASAARNLSSLTHTDHVVMAMVGGDGTQTMAEEAGYLSTGWSLEDLEAGSSVSSVKNPNDNLPYLLPTCTGTKSNIAKYCGLHRHDNLPQFLRSCQLVGLTSAIAHVTNLKGEEKYLCVGHTMAMGRAAEIIHRAEAWKYAWWGKGSDRPYIRAAGEVASSEGIPPFWVRWKINNLSEEVHCVGDVLFAGIRYFATGIYSPGTKGHGGALVLFPEKVSGEVVAAMEAKLRSIGKSIWGYKEQSLIFGDSLVTLPQDRQQQIFNGNTFELECFADEALTRPAEVRLQTNGDPNERFIKAKVSVMERPYPALAAANSSAVRGEPRISLT